MKYFIFSFLMFLLPVFAIAQEILFDGEGDAAFKSNDFKTAIYYYDKDLEENGINLYTLFLRGLSKMNIKEYESAIQDFTKIIEKKTVVKNEFWDIGPRAIKVGDTYLESGGSVSLKYSYIDIYFYRGLSKYYLSDMRGAIIDLNKYISFDTNSDNAFYFRGVANFELKKFEEAIIDFTKAIKIDGKNGLFFYNRGAAYLNLGKKDEGCIDMSKAGELGYSQAYKIIKDVCK